MSTVAGEGVRYRSNSGGRGELPRSTTPAVGLRAEAASPDPPSGDKGGGVRTPTPTNSDRKRESWTQMSGGSVVAPTGAGAGPQRPGHTLAKATTPVAGEPTAPGGRPVVPGGAGGVVDVAAATGPEHADRQPISGRAAWGLGVLSVILTVLGVVDLTFLVSHDGNSVLAEHHQLRRVFWCGWITAASTGLGALPFLVFGTPHAYWVGICNAVASGMMISASLLLWYEGATASSDTYAPVSVAERSVLGVICGVVFILATQKILAKHDDLKFSGFSGASAKKMLLIMAVMTLHSFTEGVGIGVAFAGEKGGTFGMFISTTLAIHNVPEGLAICLVLIPRGVPLGVAALWSIFSSLPQPVMSVPAFYFVKMFLPLLPVGLGFAAGAMLWVAFFELLAESIEEIGKSVAMPTCAIAAAGMAVAQHYLK